MSTPPFHPSMYYTIEYAVLAFNTRTAKKILQCRVSTYTYRDIPFYVINDRHTVIEDDGQYWCRCRRMCWHVFGVEWGMWMGWNGDGGRYVV